MSPTLLAHPFRALSLSYKYAPLAVREHLALDEEASRLLLRMLRQEMELTDLLVLSTCQRTEVYYAAEHDYNGQIIQALGRVKHTVIPASWQPCFEAFPLPKPPLSTCLRWP